MKRIHVVVGILRDAQGKICISLRPSHKHLGNLWEFPGGKLELDEMPVDALKREFFEELGVQVIDAAPLLQIPFDYEHYQVLLDFFIINQFHGEAHGKEGQKVTWVGLDELQNYAMPEANQPVIDALMKRV